MKTIEQLYQQYEDNCMWGAEGSVAKARAALEALKLLRVRRPSSSGHSSAQMTFQEISDEIKSIEAFLAASDGGSGCARTSFTGLRSRWSR